MAKTYATANEAVEANIGLVQLHANRLIHMGLPFEDLVQEGALGVMRAWEKYEPEHRNEKGEKTAFSTYASWWIVSYMHKALANNGVTVRLPLSTVKWRKRMRELERKHELLHGSALTDDALAAALGIIVTTASQARAALNQTFCSLDAPVPYGHDDTGVTTHLERLPSPNADAEELLSEAEAQHAQRAEFARCFRGLDPRERHILTQRYLADGCEKRTLADVGRLYGLSRERIRQIEERAIAKLRHACMRAASE